MERGLFIAASGMLADQLRQDVIANNLANASTSGYKGDRAVGEAFSSLLLKEVHTGRDVGSLGLGARIAEVRTDVAQGALRATQNPYDLAISGDGYFAVQTQAGTRYTRDGAFTLDAQGRIVTARGEAVLSTGGQPVTVGANGQATIDPQGNVIVDGKTVATLQVATLDPGSVRKEGDDHYTGTVQANGRTGTVEQGFLEQSNVNAVREMVDLIATMRSFESSQKVMQALDETLGKATNDVGRL